VVLPADDPDAPTYLRTPAVPNLQSQWPAKAGRAGAWTGLGCGGLYGGLLLALELHEGNDVLRALVFLVGIATVAALAGSLAFSCLANCLEAAVAALARRYGRQRPARVPARSALRRTDALAGRAPGGMGETAISGPPDCAPPKARDEIQRGDAVERREE
jgi:hypothetical protein